jgi:hypothetical protein
MSRRHHAKRIKPPPRSHVGGVFRYVRVRNRFSMRRHAS